MEHVKKAGVGEKVLGEEQLLEVLFCYAERRTVGCAWMSILLGFSRAVCTYLLASPACAEDDEHDGYVLNGINLFDLTPLEIEEQRSLAGGGYVGVRRVVRILEDGDAVKRAVDAAIDSNGQLINLRMSIMK